MLVRSHSDVSRRAVLPCRYVRWAQATYSSGAAEVRLVLERCVRECHAHEQYRQDPRFVKLCIKYADACTDAETVFDFMAKQQVGSKCAVFYVARAAMHETSQNYKAAERVFEDGLRRGALPLDDLQARMAAFQRRKAKHVKTSDGAKKPSRSKPSSAGRSRDQRTGHRKERQTLQRIGSRSAASGRRPMSRATGGAHPNARRREATSAATEHTGARAQPTIAGNFQIFDDTDPTDSTGATSEDNSAPWSQLAPHTQRHKENNAAASVWTECTIAQREGSSVPAATFSVFTDGGCEGTATSIKSHGVSGQHALRQHLDQPDTASACDSKVHTMLNPSDQSSQRAPSGGGLAIFEDKPAEQGRDADDAIQLTIAQDHQGPNVQMTDEHSDNAAEASPTVNTAAAFDDIACMFSGPVTRTASDASCTDDTEVLPASSAPPSSTGLCIFEDTPAPSGGGLAIFEDKPAEQGRDADTLLPTSGGFAIFTD